MKDLNAWRPVDVIMLIVATGLTVILVLAMVGHLMGWLADADVGLNRLTQATLAMVALLAAYVGNKLR